MASTYFISDLHLSPERRDITACLRQFLADDAVHCDALYILGDLFEVWVGDDYRTPFTDGVAAAFAALAATGVPIYFIHGNRDFLLRQAFASRAGMTLLAPATVIDLYGTATLIMHGDELCTRDIAYQAFRKKARSWWWPRLVLALPLWLRQRIAARGRKISVAKQATLSQAIMDVTPSEVQKVMAEHGVTQLIHGHTHRPDIHQLTINQVPCQRIVLGDWYTQGSVLTVNQHQLTLTQRPLAAAAPSTAED